MILTELKNARGNVAKVNILVAALIRCKSVSLFYDDITVVANPLHCFYLAYNPNYSYGIKFKTSDIDYSSFKDLTVACCSLLSSLSNRSITGHEAKIRVAEHCQEHGDLVKAICTKKLDCGVTATTINKVLPGSIPQFRVQLAKEVTLAEVPYPRLIEPKLDGVRIVITKLHEKVWFRTRSGKYIHLPYCSDQLKSLPRNIMLDTEVVIGQGLPEDRPKVSGMINSARHGNTIDELKLAFHCFDAMPFEDFNQARCSLRYPTRRTLLKETLSSTGTSMLQVVPSVLGGASLARETYEQAIREGKEGIMLKTPDHYYGFRRSKDWIKVKECKSVELKCTGVEEGDGKYTGMIGALVCTGQVEGVHVIVKVGSGLTDLDRQQSHDSYLAKDIEVKYNSVIKGTINYSLFLPRFVTIRNDLK